MDPHHSHPPRRKAGEQLRSKIGKPVFSSNRLPIGATWRRDQHPLERLENRRMLSVTHDSSGYISVTPGAGDPVVYVDTSSISMSRTVPRRCRS